jgi:hypothetical protein
MLGFVPQPNLRSAIALKVLLRKLATVNSYQLPVSREKGVGRGGAGETRRQGDKKKYLKPKT